MPEIQIEWLDHPQQIMKVIYPKGWTWDNYHQNIDRVAEMMEESDNPIYFINIYEKGVSIPRTTPAPHYRRTARVLLIGHVVYVTTDMFLMVTLRNFLSSINYTENEQYHFADTIDDALTIVQRVKSKKD